MVLFHCLLQRCYYWSVVQRSDCVGYIVHVSAHEVRTLDMVEKLHWVRGSRHLLPVV